MGISSEYATMLMLYFIISCYWKDTKLIEIIFCRKFQTMEMSSEYATRHMLSNSMMKEYEITIGNMNKVKIILMVFFYSALINN
jgi:hypothetical protein